ncbi:hypothetical protein FE257_003792 [Aspergillus nanangensis]|uniref:Uncharacterized protein n=1 Tax=Aspergillus nanangensis TaxID=2582783 RepID=A0AAD4GNB6_ASPNN|nr:hypothetical protein FE257_003792 [Aspergillus nanangensis]
MEWLTRLFQAGNGEVQRADTTSQEQKPALAQIRLQAPCISACVIGVTPPIGPFQDSRPPIVTKPQARQRVNDQVQHAAGAIPGSARTRCRCVKDVK